MIHWRIQKPGWGPFTVTILLLARNESAISSILGVIDLAKLKRVVGENQDFIQMSLLQYYSVIGCSGRHKHMLMRFGCAPFLIDRLVGSLNQSQW